ncbi:MAG: hypothetical protein C0502_09230, partial [Opitutus sp.]|nr:hypothetical protein [Opitutus sp.]
MKFPHLLSTLVLAAALTATAQEEPTDKGGDRKPAPAAAPEKDPAPSVTEGEVTIGGKIVRYKAT